MGRWKRNIVGAFGALRATRSSGFLAEELEPRKLLSAIPSPIDLSGSFAKFVPFARAGRQYIEKINVGDAGGTPASGLLPIVVSTSPDGSLADATVLTTIQKQVNIKAGRSIKIALNLQAPARASAFFLIVQLDPNNTFGDGNLANNTFSVPTRVSVRTSAFKLGPVSGQAGWVEFNSVASPASTAVVTRSVSPPPHVDRRTILINRAVGESIGVAPPVDITSAAPFTVTAQVDVNYNFAANGPFSGLNLFGNNGATEIAAFGVDATSGNVFDSANGPGSFLLSDGSQGSPARLVPGTWNTFKIVANFAGGGGGSVTLTYFLNNKQVDTEITTGVTLSSLSNAYIWSQEGFGAKVDTAGSAAFDNYSLTTTAPSTLPQFTGLTFP